MEKQVNNPRDWMFIFQQEDTSKIRGIRSYDIICDDHQQMPLDALLVGEVSQ